MRAEILCVGTELLLGQIIDTNAAYIAGQLSRAGIDVHRKQTAGDNLERIVDCIRGAMSRADVLLITGGLGPTTDDMTREAIALALDVPLIHHQELEDELRDFFKSRQINMVESTFRQAYLPEGATAIPNSNGTAPGVQWEHDGKMIFAVPGVPREMKAMLDLSIIPHLLERIGGERRIIVNRVLRTFGIGESVLAEPLEDILTTSQNPTVAPLLFGQTEVHLRLTAKARDEAEAKTLLDDMEAQVRARQGQHIFGVDDQTMAAVVLRALKQRNATLAVAESVTGGLIDSMLTDIAGASEVLQLGVVSYTNEAKIRVLDIAQSTIDEHGVVSAQTAQAMAENVRRVGNTTFGLATTGEAGPTSSSGQPVGTVFVGLSDQNETHHFQREFIGDRIIIKQRASMFALDVLRRHIMGLPQL